MPSTPTPRRSPCSICGTPVGSAAAHVPNPVCDVCDSRAETVDGRPADAAGEPNPVVIDGHTCWRQYTLPADVDAGGVDHLTIRDAVGCDSVHDCIRRHTDADGEPLQWFAPGPTGEPMQIRSAPDSGEALEAFFDQFDSSTAFRIVSEEGGSTSVTADQPVAGPTRLPAAAVGLTAPPTFELMTVEASPQRVQLSVPEITAVEVVTRASLPALDEGSPDDRVDRYRQLAAVAPGLLKTESLWPLIDDDSTAVRYDAIRTVESVVEDRPEVGLTAVDRLVDRLDDDRPIRLYAVRSLATVAERFPEAVVDITPEIIDQLNTESSLLNAAVTQFLLPVAEHNPTAALDATPAIASLLSPTPTRARRQALAVLSVIAESFPEEVRPLVPQLCSILDADDAPYRISCTAALGHVTAAYPDAATPVVPTLLDQLTAYDPELRGNSVGVLGDIAQGFPTDVAPYTDEIAPLLDDSDPTVRSNTAGTLARIADEFPGRIDPFVPQVVELLEDSWTQSRVHACWVLGHCEASEAVDSLTEHRREDPSDAVRARAAWALKQID
ncbi:HEAT repeat protein [Halohasta litchfieldiae]|jgi:HEAT repeat protein|uniref:HEAT repeat n=1 Tax=Halohasta litchfieldiae TaxID=1073996 RepID=A0A1H6W7T3_9EURY|nr:HEAT repeat domain-containing protein [Halohasta litchfieldiae]ATW87047.1 HEAT repeat protein [Halohasta litchfieldiae]SEJ12963.1 HEAT repeat [Halohasta litchfieldiae]